MSLFTKMAPFNVAYVIWDFGEQCSNPDTLTECPEESNLGHNIYKNLY